MAEKAVTTCPTCGAPCGPSLSARLADLGHDPLEHCTIAAIYAGKPRVPCVGRKNPKILRQCELCPVSKLFGTWKIERGKATFEVKKDDKPAHA